MKKYKSSKERQTGCNPKASQSHAGQQQRAKKLSRPKNRSYVHDFYTEKAMQEGYQARSVWKLSEMDRQHKLLNSGMRVLELGAAPGSWSRYVLQRIQSGPRADNAWLCAVDLQELHLELQNAAALSFFRADFTSAELQQQIMPYLATGGLFDVLLSDMAPHTTGNRTVDTGRSEALIDEILSVLPRFLKRGGTLLFKLFQGGAEQRLQQQLQYIFRSSQCLKPQAVRSQSFELYFLCRGYRP